MVKIFFAILFFGNLLNAQNKQLLYDFIEIPQALIVNPGMETGFQWHAGIPMLSGLSFHTGTSGVSVNDLFANDGLDFTQKFTERVLDGLSHRDEISTNFQIEVFSGGFRIANKPDQYYSFGMYVESDFINYWPKDLAILGFEGNADNLNREFDLGHLKTRGELLSVFHIGINKKIDRNLTIGARAKLYSSIFNLNSTRNKGYFVTTEGQNNIYSNTLDADMELRSSGIQEILDDDSLDLSRTLTKRALFGGNLGLGLDIGFTYSLTDQTVFTGSILDIGFVYHNKDIKNYTLNGRATVEGIEIILPQALANPNADFWQDLVDEIEEIVPFDNNENGFVTFRPTKLNASIRYNFGEPSLSTEDCNCGPDTYLNDSRIKYVNSIGGQIFVINRPRGPQAALTAFYQRRFGKSLALKTTYTIDKFSFSNIGVGINSQIGPVNFYIMADNLLAYNNIADTHYASFQLGLNIISWEKK
ncbi:hypothetical protein GGR42_003256 [Saonia flava]|uniref:DUF5723 domain-containing protein n=1 Tax=Saonia flava TaxID=523696 RepID=A0A846R476_9FLAO|nr:DUF5723 family protein [Saonia flava]NJB72765.1 hypothetical protein [Saonia flava]